MPLDTTPNPGDELDRAPASPTPAAPTDLRRFARLARHLAEYGQRSTAAQAIADAAVEVIHCTAAVVATLTRGDTVRFELPGAGPDHFVQKIARVAEETGQGPAAAAVGGRAPVRIDDLATDRRWPEYAQAVREQTPIRTVLVHPLHLDDTDLGVLALYDARPGFFDAEREDLSSVYADHATIALARATAAELAGHLETALASNRVIGQAVGIVMTRYRITDADAFDVLRLASQALNRKLRDVASDVVREGDLPADVRR